MPTGLQEPKKGGFEISLATDLYSCCSLVSPPLSRSNLKLDYCQALYHELLIAQALPVFDIKFTFLHLRLQTLR